MGHETQRGFGRDIDFGPITVTALAVLVEPEPIAVAKGFSSQRRCPTAMFPAPLSFMYWLTRPAEVRFG